MSFVSNVKLLLSYDTELVELVKAGLILWGIVCIQLVTLVITFYFFKVPNLTQITLCTAKIPQMYCDISCWVLIILTLT